MTPHAACAAYVILRNALPAVLVSRESRAQKLASATATATPQRRSRLAQ